ncbi:hypothetical protein PILCRDRAFT_16217 [Piloderma croceum F 1598]|uniref:Uncharacterized protein n=1 Tax=Piloderma croceum (strain F 1598) TaxID=765440 RepID=A0A0C3EWF0_PILCF|nr:hypothetical protein PILCRDRAFT_16217 [Piloderma croceum F 1598]
MALGVRRREFRHIILGKGRFRLMRENGGSCEINFHNCGGDPSDFAALDVSELLQYNMSQILILFFSFAGLPIVGSSSCGFLQQRVKNE